MTHSSRSKDPKEEAYLYDLYVVPEWREPFDQLVDEAVSLPKEGKFLDANCGTGGYALDLAARAGHLVEVIGIDPDPDRLALAQGKAEVKKIGNVGFYQGTLENSGIGRGEFDLTFADLSLISPPELSERLPEILTELKRVSKTGGTLIFKIATRGTFDEFYSYYWQALHELGWDAYTSELETLITERFTADQIEEAVKQAGFKKVQTETHNQRFQFPDAHSFLTNPLFEVAFLDRWLAILSTEAEVETIKKIIVELIDRDREDLDFEISAKLTLITATH